jgi:hypothetical protein
MDLIRWESFTRSQQLLMIGSEIMRAKVWQDKDETLFHGALERAFPLIDLSLEDKKWEDRKFSLLQFREELGKFYSGERKDSIEFLYNVL